ncbi:DNA polymerase epsilon catalytic subunit POL2 [Aspergillus aculeatinus CBS 121060]|uniref:DNA polymerase epsilon, catalytic subunit A/POL2 n=1 Tax=Aspergillus aculeatinus CBS 121060 TaxID=1448322 RepID=A0ACD1GZZ0_9EURO|nr:putative DNA polymerase epsilon, catalytic subunit A/POL2 [Aspergillus aculeatinus CBS 121060]RAH66926.1 putative DNA polymerase epsilon, catalytic subunit A/POL2 [Aspergillus aculeatinus CBS 121060]
MPSRKPSKFGNKFRSGAASFNPRRTKTVEFASLRSTEATSQDEKFEAIRLANSIDESLGFPRFEAGEKRVGWLINMHSTSIQDPNVPGGRAGVDYYFLEDGGTSFKATVEYDPYFLIAVKKGHEAEVEEWCRRMFEGLVKKVTRVEKEDLSLPNHLLGHRRNYLQLSFANVSHLLEVRRTILPLAEKNKKNATAMDAYVEMSSGNAGFDLFDDELINESRSNANMNASDFIVDIREYDVPYHVRVSIDKDIRIGKWYTVESKHGVISLSCIEERLTRADPVILAFDIETTKLPLKFPDSVIDQIMMISYMIDGQGFLITNREIVSEDINDFEYTPKAEYNGPFMIFNEPDERSVIERFFEHIKEAKPTVIATYNGDFFDWPFVEARASVLGIDMYKEIGFRKNSEDIYQADHCVHMDCFAWVNRDSYLPQGSRGLKAVTVAKLGYDPDELDPELMTPYASERPQTLAEYSVSDAVATYYLYMKYVHPFIFSLCTILPLNPDDTLRKGTGTLCEMLLMVQAYQGNIVLPNKHKDPPEAFYEGHLLESETYVGGHVESIEAGVFRSDIPVTFKVDPAAVDELLRDLDAALKFSIEVEEKKSMDDVTNYDEVKKQISDKLMGLKEKPHRDEVPFIYHLDVASMYPNIMITNRLQPDSMIEESNCAACDFNRPGKTCDRRMPWAWRGEFLPAKRDEYNMIRHAVSNEKFPGRYKNSPMRMFGDLSIEEQAGIVKKRLQDYSKKIYHKIHDSKTIVREAIICQRENPFYVDTVRSFRDRRYDFKGKQKVWKGKTEALKSSGASAAEIDEAKKMIILYDSLQLAHKVILNSFYGYVMRKGSRWYSMEMAGVTCLTGARIIQMARELVERIGRPLELDTDGIWCMLPGSFPENFTFTLKNGKKLGISYPCVMLNHLVHGSYTNHQYQTLVDPASFRYETHSDNSIFFEVDGPYKAMILPTSKEEDKNLKKRYAVFNHDGSLAELKGFEVKRRGELKLIKIFQTQIFRFFLEGSTLTETYAAVAKVADRWLDVLYEHGATLADEELIDLISENRSMTKTLEEYGNQKSTSITTARRLAEFLGEQMVKDKGLNCKYIISSRPRNTPVTERAIPVAIFSAEESVKRFFLRKWLKDDPGDMDPRTVIDWDYYLERLGSVVQKLITIPAALQKIRNPVPRVAHPDWLQRRINQKDDKFKQTKMTDMFTRSEKTPLTDISTNILDHRVQHTGDLDEVIGNSTQKSKSSPESKVSQKRKHPEGLPKTSLDPFATLPTKMPSITDDYVGFLKYQKQKWKIQQQARIRRRQLFGERVNVTTDSLSNLFRNQAELLYINTWQVLQLAETSRPGIVRAFVLIDRKVHALTVKVPRQIYVNLKQDSLPDVDVPDCEVEKVNHTLPNGHPSVHLFKLTLSEETYIREANKIDILLQHPSVEGVYERSIPLTVRAVLKLGSICTFDEEQRGVLGEGLDKGFDLSTLCHTNTDQPYLLDAPMAYHYLYHVTSGDRQIFAIFSTAKNEAHIVILNRTRDVQGLPNVDKIYAELRARRLQNLAADNTQTAFEYQEKLHFKTTQVTTRRKAHLEVGDLIKKLKSEETQPAIMVIQSHQRSRLCHDVPILKEYPILPVKPEVSDMELPPLGWQTFVARRLVTHYLYLSAWVQHMTLLARYGDVPLCNLENDDPRFMIDISYARRLQQNNVVLWWSSNPRPDHAGYEKDDTTGPLEKVPMPSVNMPNAYTTVCIELEVRNLAINTILTSSIINEMEGADTLLASSGTSADANGGVLYSEKAFTSAGAVVLREMVKNWWTEACDGNSMADIMVQHLIRWVESPASCLYDQSLHHYVRMLSRKSFQRLMAEFRRVGANIIFASSTRLLLHTTKTEVGNAYAFSQYVLKSIRANPSFHFIDLEIKEYWDYLLWYDEYNYGGKGCQEVAESDEQPLETVMHWQLSRFLPTPMQTIFHDWVVEYIELMHGLKRPDNDSSTPRMTQIPIGRPSDEESEEISAILAEKFSKPLKKQITGLIRRQRDELLHPELASDYAFPVLPGVLSNPNDEKRNPVLELVKLLMQVLSLSKTTTMETRLLRRELLALFEIREFSKEGRFENPGASLKIPELTCNACCLIRDLDLCRDEDVLPDPGTESNKSSVKPWRCPFCQTEYDRLAQEETLIGQVQGFIVGWQTQDLKCSKCGGLKISDFMEHCSCSGVWVETMNRGEIEKKLRLLDSVAKFHNLKLLETVVGEVLGQM